MAVTFQCPLPGQPHRGKAVFWGQRLGGAWLWALVSVCKLLCPSVPNKKRKDKQKGSKKGKVTSKRKHAPLLHKNNKNITPSKPKPNQTANSNTPNTLSQKVASVDFLFISSATWSYK